MTCMSLAEYNHLLNENTSTMKQRKNHSNTGQSLETWINHANEQYLHKGIACIHQIKQPVRVENRQGAHVTGYLIKSTVDYLGVYEGKAVAFDAKSVSGHLLPLSNIEEHQYEFLSQYRQNDGYAFLIVGFINLQEYFVLTYDQLKSFWEGAMVGGRKSIPYPFFVDSCRKVNQNRGIVFDYLAAL